MQQMAERCDRCQPAVGRGSVVSCEQELAGNLMENSSVTPCCRHEARPGFVIGSLSWVEEFAHMPYEITEHIDPSIVVPMEYWFCNFSYVKAIRTVPARQRDTHLRHDT